MEISKIGGANGDSLYINYQNAHAEHTEAAREAGMEVGHYFFNGRSSTPAAVALAIMRSGFVKPGEKVGWDVEDETNSQGVVTTKHWNPAEVEEYARALEAAGKPFADQFVYANHQDVRNEDWSRIVDLGIPLWVSNYGPNDGETISKTLIRWWDEAWLLQFTSRFQLEGDGSDTGLDMSVDGAGHVFTYTWLQESLNKVLVTQLVVDGDPGPKTAAAVWAFQTKAGLKIDGIAGHNTITALLEALKQ